jgi:hypothetical protein
LLAIDPPLNDPLLIIPRLNNAGPTLFATPSAPQPFKVGDQSAFWVSRTVTGTYEFVNATLRYATPHLYMWVENGLSATDADLKKSAETFENQIYPTDRRYFGSEWTPGVDNDPHVFVLNTRFRNAAGYISSVDELPSVLRPYSNQHEIIYINLDVEKPGSADYDAVLAHEFVHMIHWYQNRKDDVWVREGLAELGIKLNNYGRLPVGAFTQNPDVQLNGWAELPNDSIPHYAASYLFLAYARGRFGDGFIRDLVRSGERGPASVQKALDQDADGVRFDDLFADWTVANYLDDPTVADGHYAYPDDDVHVAFETLSRYPDTEAQTVHQYASDYFLLQPTGSPVTLIFTGTTSVAVIPTQPHGGRALWWGNRADNADTTLTRAFDLSGVQQATLKFWTWYDIEKDFDYAYVEVSTDQGKTWRTLSGPITTDTNPNGANYGNGITAHSGAQGDEPARWVEAQMDLTPFAGQNLLVRFEYITDDGVANAGFALDDISIPEIGYRDDAEADAGGWTANGFARIDNQLPQEYLLQLIKFGAQITVQRIALDAANRGAVRLDDFARLNRAVLIVSAITPVTWESEPYQFSVVNP